ncbi:MAG: glycosyltransferase family 2 protein [Planctomycetes bacterium]|nr:glycosyltransferase family 2 protein [Planctomycetota bacterium]MCW8137920.1 glycosyltransferase family 2 protein [Planctomycetota bacterium]
MTSTPRPALSLVIPAYDEAARLDATFEQVEAWLRDPPRAPVEVLLADDGSSDQTLARFEAFARAHPGVVRALALPHRGKAATVTSGILAAEGDKVLFSDADLSVPLSEAEAFARALDAGADVAIGSREAEGARREREPTFRHVMGRGFNAMVRALVVPGVKDTQCGFKMFTREAARAIFGRLRRYGPDAPEIQGPMVTAFDVEVLFLARKLGLKVVELPVLWRHGEGSKVRPVVDALRMGRDVLMVKLADMRGEYRT